MTTSTQLTVAFIETATAKELRAEAQALQLQGAWKAKKEELQQMLLATLPSTEPATPEPLTEDLWETTEPYPSCQLPLETTPPTVQALLLLNPAPTPEPEPKCSKKQPKAKKVYNELQMLTEAQVALLNERSTVTHAACSDPGRLVVKREVIRQLLEDTHDCYINEKVFNQCVVLASRKLPRQPLTIQSPSRFKYLLMETNKGQTFPPAVLVADWLLCNPQAYAQAATAYQLQAQEGLEHIQSYLAAQ